MQFSQNCGEPCGQCPAVNPRWPQAGQALQQREEVTELVSGGKTSRDNPATARPSLPRPAREALTALKRDVLAEPSILSTPAALWSSGRFCHPGVFVVLLRALRVVIASVVLILAGLVPVL